MQSSFTTPTAASPVTGFIMESLQSKAHAEAHKPVVEKTQHHKGEPGHIDEMISTFRAALRSAAGGALDVSPYDTAWVTLVRKLDGGEGPEFPLSIDWIARNQLPDGSWGDEAFFLVQDRLINTLACVIALKTWNVHSDKCNKGLSFIHENIKRLREDENRMLVAFEMTFTMLLEMAKDIGLDLPYDEPALQDIYAKRDLKLAMIPMDVLYSVPTALLFSLEGIPGLDWDRLFKLQSPDGSFSRAPAATAYALLQTGNKKCLEFLTDIVNKFNGGAPFIYPLELFERLWVVDRLERLGISSYFRSEIGSYLDYVYRHWSDEGIGSTWNSKVKDLDDTAMGIRLLRQHGYHVSIEALKCFEAKDFSFFQTTGFETTSQSVTAMYNVYRVADQAAFPGDDGVIQRAKAYSYAFLQQRRAAGDLNDKWIISSGLPSELAYGLDFPWKANLPRVQTRMYLEQYGGSKDVWIGKNLYRMNLVNNDLLLKLAKADFSNFQRQCRLECQGLERWCEKNNLEMYGVTPQSAVRAYFLAAANIFEPDRAAERLGWARTAVIAQAISSCFLSSNPHVTESMLEELNSELTSEGHNLARHGEKYSTTENSLLNALHELINLFAPGEDASNNLREAWKSWLIELTRNGGHESCEGNTALLLVRIVEIYSGRHCSANQNLKLSEYSQLEKLTSSICSKLGSRTLSQVNRNGTTTENTENLEQQVDQEMQELAQCVFQTCDAISRVTKETFLHVTRTYYYVAHSSSETIDSHISKVIFEDVMGSPN
ncbi:syn-copalyl diphosphate synthase, chloroplastic-like [Panicum virgatum]|uniref:Terpene synthase N-terminal domain-containing protein n=1 Tax=Panicum virgatum TaxID=38727 RepID=A0A8T0WUI5_PANVG|nr:syn-copalyl diphosphate synthase, chloroplastic-like [Panicum virgatum]KAG2651500.1 hypothetical protein PVAP13_1NG307400 [Panicum virgatum]